jgi:hypothetical protein
MMRPAKGPLRGLAAAAAACGTAAARSAAGPAAATPVRLPLLLVASLLLPLLLLLLPLLFASRLLLPPALRLSVGVAKLGAAVEPAALAGAELLGLLTGAGAGLLLLLLLVVVLLLLKASFSTSMMSSRLSFADPPGPVACSLVMALACCVMVCIHLTATMDVGVICRQAGCLLAKHRPGCRCCQGMQDKPIAVQALHTECSILLRLNKCNRMQLQLRHRTR